MWIKWLFCWHYVDNSVFLPVFTPFYPLFKAKHYLITNVWHSNFTHRATRLLYQSRCLKQFCLPIGAQKMLYLFPSTKWFEPRQECAVGCSTFCNKVSVIIVVGYGHVVSSLGCTHSVHVVGKCTALQESNPRPCQVIALPQYSVGLPTASYSKLCPFRLTSWSCQPRWR